MSDLPTPPAPQKDTKKAPQEPARSVSAPPVKKAQKTSLLIYAALGLSLLMGFVPTVTMAGVSVVFFLATLMAAYIVRYKTADDSLSAHHMTYIIRSIWIVSGLSVITVTAGSVIMITNMNPYPLLNCLDSLGQSGAVPEYDQFRAMVGPCLGTFMAENRGVLSIAGSITVIPVVLYLVYRLARGISTARKGQKFENVKKFF